MSNYKYCRISDTSLAYLESGQGEPLILLHGNGESSEYFESQISEFSSFFHVYAIDSRAHGKSARGKKPLTLERMADDLLEFIDKLGIQKANILGFSDGGNIALLFALKYQSRVNKLIVDGANFNTKGVSAVFRLGVLLDYGVTGLFSRLSVAKRQKKEILSLMIGQPNITKAQLASMDIPTLVMAGTKDMIKRSHTKSIAEYIKASKLMFIKGSHFIAKENPVEFNRAVIDFLGKH